MKQRRLSNRMKVIWFIESVENEEDEGIRVERFIG